MLDPKLTVYNDYQWIEEFYKDKLSKDELKGFNNEIDELFNYLKHYSIRNTTSKSNTLIVKHILNDYSLKEIAKSILKNAKYTEFEEIYKVINNN